MNYDNRLSTVGSIAEFEADLMALTHQRSIPEKGLIAAIVLRALRDLHPEPNRDSREWVRHAEGWFKSKAITPFSFRWCMQHLGLFVKPVILENLLTQARSGHILGMAAKARHITG